MKGCIDVTQEGYRLDSIVSAACPDRSRSQIKNVIENGHVMVNGTVCTKPGRKCRQDEHVSWDFPELPNPDNPAPQPNIHFRIVHQDSHLFVIDKPAGLVVHPGAGHLDGTLVNGLLSIDPSLADVGEPDRPGIVHRLDAETGGLLVVARSQESYEKLTQMFANHDVYRQYWAVCHAPKLPDHGRFDTPYGRHPTQRIKFSCLHDGNKRAITDYRVVSRNDRGFALVTCLLETGRTHQVRVHLSEHHAPILGDILYAPTPYNKQTKCMMLFAKHLCFSHPITGQPCAFEVPFPDEFVSVMNKLGLSQREVDWENNSKRQATFPMPNSCPLATDI